MPATLYRSPIPDQLWDRTRDEFGLPDLEQVRERLAAMHEDPEPVVQQLIRVVVGEGTFCPGYQFRADLSLNPVVGGLFKRALELRIPHNSPSGLSPLPGELHSARPVEILHRTQELHRALEGLAAQLSGSRRSF